MKLIGNTTYCLLYLLFILNTFAFGCFLFTVILRMLSPWLPTRHVPFKKLVGQMPTRIPGPVIVTGLASFIVMCFLFKGIFFNFYAFEIEPQKIVLHYFWPRKDVVIQKVVFQTFDLDIDRKGSGVLTFFANGKRFDSAASIEFGNTNAIIFKLQQWKQ